MKYLLPFELVRRSTEISIFRGELCVNVSYEGLVSIVQAMLERQFPFGMSE
ncbi:MAG: hypothetical protein QOG25_1528 [Acetobacteraceae bacterium]|nr:hypothetical protein [Acetobacteraceae bacterium]